MNDQDIVSENITLIDTLGLLALTALSEAPLSFGILLTSLLLVWAVWLVVDRKPWLLTMSGLAIVFATFNSASTLF